MLYWFQEIHVSNFHHFFKRHTFLKHFNYSHGVTLLFYVNRELFEKLSCYFKNDKRKEFIVIEGKRRKETAQQISLLAAFFCESFCWEFLWLLLTLMCVGNHSEKNPYNCPNLLKSIYRICQVNFAAFWEANKTRSVEKRPQKPVIYLNWPLANTVECFSSLTLILWFGKSVVPSG